MSRKNLLSALAGGLVLALLSGCDGGSSETTTKVMLKRGVPVNVSCPKGMPTWRIKDTRTVVWECLEGGDPIFEEVAAK